MPQKAQNVKRKSKCIIAICLVLSGISLFFYLCLYSLIMIKIKKISEWLKSNKINAAIILIVVILFISMIIKENGRLFTSTKGNDVIQTQEIIKDKKKKLAEDELKVIIFSQPLCSHCKKQKKYINKVLKPKYLNIKFEYHDITKASEMGLLKKYYKQHGISQSKLATPSTFIGNDYIIGYKSNEKTGKRLDALIRQNLPNKKIEKDKVQSQEKTEDIPQYIDTWFGKINILEMSLPMLAITLGYIDGFNPCTMWVLTYLISLVITMNDKKKIWLVVGSFVFASAALYYLFMTAMLSVFLYVGYLRILELIIGCFALCIGIIHIKSFIVNKGQIFCKISGGESKQKTMSRIDKLVDAELSFMTVMGVIALAFVVNSIEFVCSAALPAIYTSILSKANLPWIQYHMYMLLYIFFFMLNEIIVFSFAAFAAEKYISEKYIAPCKLMGGVILFILGALLIFFPEHLST